MSRDREAEIESLRRENERLRQDVLRRREAGRARRFDDAPAASQEPDRVAAQSAAEPNLDRLADRLEDVISAMQGDLATALDSSVRSVAGSLDDLNSAMLEDVSARDRELSLKLEQLSSEIQQLRGELAATRLQLDARSNDARGLDGPVSVPGIIIDQESFQGHDGPRRWRQAGRPWFYLPLVWGLVLLVLVLAILLIWW